MSIVEKTHVNLLKICLIIVLLVSITGCSVEYNLDISKNKMVENVVILNDVNSLNGVDVSDKLDGIIASNTAQGELLYNYDIEKYLNTDEYGLKLNLDNYQLSSFKTCFSNFSITTDGDYYLINGSSGFNCLNIWDNDYDVKINIKIHGKIVDSNADSVKKNVATWVIDNENDSIYLRYKLSNSKNNLFSTILIFSLLIIIAFVSVYIYIKNKKNNEI